MPVMRELEPAVCERLLRRATVGRVVVSTPRGPEIVPVNYAVDQDTIVIRTTPGGLLARYGDGAVVVFEIDALDHERWHGWSVVARGGGVVVHPPNNAAGRRTRVRPWAHGDRTSELRVTWSELTGRQVGAGWDVEAAVSWQGLR
jgi:hypothetical protein